MSQEFPYAAEYAKSGRASCRACKTTIIKDALRLAAMVQSPMHDGKIPHWYHYACFFGKQRPKSVADIGHFDVLRWEDQEKIKSKIAEGPSAVESPAGSKKKASKRGKGKGEFQDFTVEYAKSSRAMCRGCELKIAKDEVRISKKDYESEGARMYGGQDMWHHVECFAKLRNKLEFWASGEQLPGFQALKKEDKDEVKKILPEGAKPAVKDEVDGAPETKKVKKESSDPSKEDEDLKKQNKFLYKYIDFLKGISRKTLIQLLDFNNQKDPGGDDPRREALADCMAFGRLEPCAVCKEGQLVYTMGVGYKCTGDISEWSKCEHTETQPKRKKFKIPEDLLEDHPFLTKYKCKIGTRIIPDLKPSNSAIPSTSDGPQVERFVPFKHMKFFAIGRFEKPSDLKKRIHKLGGMLESKFKDDIDVIISTPEEVEKLAGKMEKAAELGINVVPVSYIELCEKEGNAMENMKKLSLCTWGKDPGKKIAERAAKSSMMIKSGKSGSGRFLKSMPSKVKLKVKGGHVVDPDSGLEDVAKVYSSHGDFYDAILGLTDVQQGKNSFYKLQLLQSNSGNKFWLFRSWGRIGTTIGGNKCDKLSLEEAKLEFKRLYEEKSGNEFENRKNFVKVPGRMYPIEVDYGENETIKLSSESKVASKLHSAIQNLVSMIFDVDTMKRVMMEFELDMDKMPLGKLSKSQIQKALAVLSELQSRDGDIKPLVVKDATNRFYTLIPHNFGMDNPPLLDNKDIIKTKLEMLESLMEMEVAYSVLQETQGAGGEDEHPVDKHYKKLNTHLEVLESESEEFSIIDTYIKNTHAETHGHYRLELQQVFKVKREGEERRFKPFKKLHNRKLLWHGSRLTNFAGILSQGLRIAPPEAPVTGYMFGKGIYFADMVSKSANYCMTSPQNSTGLLLLCEVALGDMYERTKAEMITTLPKGKHSTRGIGATQPDPSASVCLPDGVEVPLGKGVQALSTNQTSLLYNEYIVYDVAQVKARYLLKVNFQYNY